MLAVVLTAGCDPQVAPQGPSPTTTPVDASRLRISGQVTEPAANAPVEAARVCWSPSSRGQCTETGPDGTYLLLTDRPSYPPTVLSARLAPTVHKEGYEWRQSWIPDDFSGFLRWSPGLQRIQRIDAGASLAGTVYPQEGSGLVEDSSCEGCKRIRIEVPRDGHLTVRLIVGSESLRLAVHCDNSQPADTPFAVQAGMTVFVCVTNAVVPTAFQLSTILAPAK